MRRLYKWLRKEVQGKRERERYTQLNAELLRTARRDKKAFFKEQCKEIEENNKVGKTIEISLRNLEISRKHFMLEWSRQRPETVRTYRIRRD